MLRDASGNPHTCGTFRVKLTATDHPATMLAGSIPYMSAQCLQQHLPQLTSMVGNMITILHGASWIANNSVWDTLRGPVCATISQYAAANATLATAAAEAHERTLTDDETDKQLVQKADGQAVTLQQLHLFQSVVEGAYDEYASFHETLDCRKRLIQRKGGN